MRLNLRQGIIDEAIKSKLIPDCKVCRHPSVFGQLKIHKPGHAMKLITLSDDSLNE